MDSSKDKIVTLTEADEGLMLAELMEILEEIDVDSPMAKLNETSIADNNGGRIYF